MLFFSFLLHGKFDGVRCLRVYLGGVGGSREVMHILIDNNYFFFQPGIGAPVADPAILKTTFFGGWQCS